MNLDFKFQICRRPVKVLTPNPPHVSQTLGSPASATQEPPIPEDVLKVTGSVSKLHKTVRVRAASRPEGAVSGGAVIVLLDPLVVNYQ